MKPLAYVASWNYELKGSPKVMSSIDDILELCEARIGYQFRDRTLLRRCLTHSSAAETRLDSNERLEFLGDAVLGIIICEYLYQLFPEQREGQLTQMKSWLVSRQTCARVAKVLDLQPMILVGRGLQVIPESILSAAVESLVAGVYFDGGLDAARSFILHAFREELSLCRPVDSENYKSQLQEYTQRELGKTPEYLVVGESGPDHAREFLISAKVGEVMYESGRGRSKKEAEQQAARNAVLSLLQDDEDGASNAPSVESSDLQCETDADAVCDTVSDVATQTSSTCAMDGAVEIQLMVIAETVITSTCADAEFGCGCNMESADDSNGSDACRSKEQT